MIHERKYYPPTRFPVNDYCFTLSPEGKMKFTRMMGLWKISKKDADKNNRDYCLLFVNRSFKPAVNPRRIRLDQKPIPKPNLHNTRSRKTLSQQTGTVSNRLLETAALADPVVMKGRISLHTLPDNKVSEYLEKLRKQKITQTPVEVHWNSAFVGGTTKVYRGRGFSEALERNE